MKKNSDEVKRGRAGAHYRGMQRSAPARLAASFIGVLALASCGPQVTLDDAGDPAATDDGDGESGEPQVDPPPTAEFPPPSAYGVDVVDPNFYEARHERLTAVAVRRVDPEIVELEVLFTRQAPVDAQSWPTQRIEVFAHGPDCDEAGKLLWSQGDDGREQVVPSDPMLSALVEDSIAAQASGTCGDRPDPGLDPNMWDPPFCATNRVKSQVLDALVEGLLTLRLPSIMPHTSECDAIPVELERELCIAAVVGAHNGVQAAAALKVQLEHNEYLLDRARDEVQSVAQAGNLGLPNPWPLRFIDALDAVVAAIQISRYRLYGRRLLGERVAHLTSARYRVGQHPQLVALHEELELFIDKANLSIPAWEDYSGCVEDISHWIAMVSMARFGIRVIITPLGPFFPLDDTDSDLSRDDSELIEGAFHPMSMGKMSENPMIVDIDTLTTEQREHTYDEIDGHVFRYVHAGYEWEQGAALASDIIGPHLVTGLPEVIAAAGTPIFREEVPPRGDDKASVYVGPHGVTLDAIGLDVNWEEVDDADQPLEPDLVQMCKVPLLGSADDFVAYCGFGIETTGSPEQIAAGERAKTRFRVHTTSGIPDLQTGEPTEELTGFIVEISAALEAPQGCWEWDGTEYVGSSEPCEPDDPYGGDGGGWP